MTWFNWAEVFERQRSKVEIVKADSLELPTKREMLMMETAYRRGFQQGACAAAYWVVDGMHLESVVSWAERDLHKWRYAQHGGKMVFPPDPKAKK
jgi:hypothetical protein